jgi:hypothetical protein
MKLEVKTEMEIALAVDKIKDVEERIPRYNKLWVSLESMKNLPADELLRQVREVDE